MAKKPVRTSAQEREWLKKLGNGDLLKGVKEVIDKLRKDKN